jgi:hypothetical protein
MSPVIPAAEPNAFCETAALVPGVRSCGFDMVANTAEVSVGVTLPLVSPKISLVLELVVFEFASVFVLLEPVSEDKRSLAALETPEVLVVLSRNCDPAEE